MNLITADVLNNLISSSKGFIKAKLPTNKLGGEFEKSEHKFKAKLIQALTGLKKTSGTNDSSKILLNSIKGDAWEQLATSILNLRYPDSEIVPQLCTYVNSETGIYTHRVDTAIKNENGKWDLFEIKWGGTNGNADSVIDESIEKQQKSAKLTGQDKYFGDYTVLTLTDSYTLKDDFKDLDIKQDQPFAILETLAKASLQEAPYELFGKNGRCC